MGWSFVASAVLVAASLMQGDVIRVLTDLQKQDQRIASVGYRLAHENLSLCRDGAHLTGITPHYAGQYGPTFRHAAQRLFLLSEKPSVLAVAAGSPADRAGVRPNDRLVAADGQSFQSDPADRKAIDFTFAERALDQIDAASADGRMTLRIERNGAPLTMEIAPERACPSRFQVVPGEGLKAQADGRYIQISTGSIDFARDTDELASVLAHELAHNILHHRIRLEGQGALSRGLFGPGRRNARLIRETEIEADRLSPYLMAQAGYDPRAAVRYWQRHGGERGDRWFRAGTHPGWRDRVRIIEAEVRAIENAKAQRRTIAVPADLLAGSEIRQRD